MAGPQGLVTGIGSLPYRQADKAVDLIFKYAPQIPFWPQLPKRDMREGMIAQFSEGLPCIKVTDKDIVFNPQDKEIELEKFYEKIISQDREYFKISQDYAQGLHLFYQRLGEVDLRSIDYIKCQITGPFTFASGINDEKGIALLHDAIFMQAIIKGLIMKAQWQVKFFRRFGKKIIIFIDEPYLGCFGSAYTPLNREEVVKGLAELTQGIRARDVLSGVHCCGNTDWSIFTEIKTMDIISFDAFSFMDKFVLYAENLKDFLKRSGIICWGLVPTQEFTQRAPKDLIVKKFKQGTEALFKKGLDRNLLLANFLLSPACGLGALETDMAEKIFALLSEVSLLIRQYLDSNALR